MSKPLTMTSTPAEREAAMAASNAQARRTLMVHAVTRYDRQQQARAERNPRAYYNHYALGQYLMAVDRVEQDMKAGKSAADAINNNFNGALARALHKALATGDTDTDTKRRELFK